MAAAPPADGVPGGDAGLGLPGVFGLDDLQEIKNKNRRQSHKSNDKMFANLLIEDVFLLN